MRHCFEGIIIIQQPTKLASDYHTFSYTLILLSNWGCLNLANTGKGNKNVVGGERDTRRNKDKKVPANAHSPFPPPPAPPLPQRSQSSCNHISHLVLQAGTMWLGG
jgi:hypothetical protein